jgi:hypothetical protein
LGLHTRIARADGDEAHGALPVASAMPDEEQLPEGLVLDPQVVPEVGQPGMPEGPGSEPQDVPEVGQPGMPEDEPQVAPEVGQPGMTEEESKGGF